jgi:hypothetical protein
VSVLEIGQAARARSDRGQKPTRARPTRPPSGNARGATPRLKPAISLPAPTVAPPGSGAQPRACRTAPAGRREPSAAAAPTSSWRLTERGIAVVLVLAAMVAVAALAVVVPTAFRVTGGNYQPTGSSQFVRP